MVQELGSTEGSWYPMTQTSTPKSEEVVTKVMKVDKVVKLFKPWQLWVWYGQFDSGGKYSEEHFGYNGEGEDNVTRGIG